jgi:hypothetical protein
VLDVYRHDAEGKRPDGLQLLLPFVTFCGRHTSPCPLVPLSSAPIVACERCGCIARARQ